MDLVRVLRTLRRHKWIVLLSTLVGVGLAFLSLYEPHRVQIGQSSTLKFERRSHTTYEVSVNVLIDTPGFGAGRADTPMNKPVLIAPTFASLALSDDVQDRVEKEVGEHEVEIAARAVDRNPLFTLTATGQDLKTVRKVVSVTSDELIAYIMKEQEENDIPADARLFLRVVNTQELPVKSRDAEIALVMLLAPVVGGIALALAMENVASAPAGAGAGAAQVDEDADDEQGEITVLPSAVGDSGAAQGASGS